MTLRSDRNTAIMSWGTMPRLTLSRAVGFFRSLVLFLLVVLLSAATVTEAKAGNDVRIRMPTPATAPATSESAVAAPSSDATPAIVPPSTVITETDYVLGIGDKVRLTVYGEDDLSGEYEVSSTGVMALPLIGAIKATGTTVREFEDAVRKKLKAGYLNDPRVSAQVTNYRPFFILGEVSKPGSYPYVNGMSVLNAVALAGGYSYRADTDGVTIMHASDSEKKEQSAREDAVVMPGDIVRVPERLF